MTDANAHVAALEAQMDELQRRQAEFDDITARMDEGLVLFSGKGMILFANHAARALFPHDSAEGSYLTLCRDANYIQVVEQALDGKGAHGKLERNGRIYELTASSVEENSAWHAAVLLIVDITERERAEQQRQEFTANVSHELKTPLTSLIGYADLLRGGTLDAERRRTAAEALYHESARLESLSQQLLALNGLQADGVVLRPVRVAAAFADAVRSLPDVVLDCDAPAEAVVLADRVLLADLVRNLALNAWHAGPQDGAVHLRCTDAGECWRLTVQDTGCGIPAEALPHLTEPFYRVDKARARANGGSGVGLALCAQITEAFGTQMTFASRVGEGTTVTILLQKEAEHEEAAQQQ